jgi:uncharacterized protein (TIGR02270 family)
MMPTSAHLRPRGFRPDEISRLVNRPVVEEHIDQASFLWNLRTRAIDSPHYKLLHLARLDERLIAHLEGVRNAGETGWALACLALETGDPGSCFLVGWLAFQNRSPETMRLALQCGLSTEGFTDALVAALSWIDPGHVREPLQRLALSDLPAHKRLQLAVAGAHRLDSGNGIAQALEHPDAALRSRALRAVGECRRSDLTDVLRRHLDDSDPRCRFWAAWSLLLVGEPNAAGHLIAASANHATGERMAIEHAVRSVDLATVQSWVRTWASATSTRRLGIVAAGALGDPAVIPWLLQRMAEPELARVAGEAFSTITGADLDHLGLKRDAPVFDPDTQAACDDPADDDLVWPDVEGIAAWWQDRREAFELGRRYLMGEPLTAHSLAAVLRGGYQRQRSAAAFELARLAPEAPLFATAARGDWQKQRLAA